jgi:hypothetical protein
MSILAVILILAIIGLILWLVTSFIPMPLMWRNLIIAVVAILVLIWLLSVLGLLPALNKPIVPSR